MALSTVFLPAAGAAGNRSVIVFFTLALIGLLAAVVVLYLVLENRRKRRAVRQVRRGGEEPGREKRRLPRQPVPEALAVVLTLTDSAFFGLAARAVDVSADGFAIRPDFPLKRLPLGLVLNNVLVNTPVNHFVVRRARTVRIEHHFQKRLLALRIDEMEEDQRREMDVFLNHLREFGHAS